MPKRKKEQTKRGNEKAECFKCKDLCPIQHLISFVCCDTDYHIQCAGYTPSRQQRSI